MILTTMSAGQYDRGNPGGQIRNDTNAGLDSVERIQRVLLGLAKRRAAHLKTCGIRVDPEDMASETMLRFYEGGGESSVDTEKGTALSLTIGIMNNVSREAFRKELHRVRRTNTAQSPQCASQDRQDETVPAGIPRTRRARLALSHVADTDDPVENAIRSEELEWLGVAIEELAPREREGLLRVARTLFGFAADQAPTDRDYVAACRAREKLRAAAKRLGLLDDED
ncbi:MAG: hypothetical protein AB7Q00_12650 [Phycisphaerales bacterium]